MTNEIECLSNVIGDEEGACVYQTTVGSTWCLRTTGTGCSELSGSNISGTPEFHAGFLCSAPELNTLCSPTKTTKCEGYDVYYLDNCGNKANIYDSSQYNNDTYWTYMSDSVPCDDGLGNKDSRTCGQCEYFQGSMCENYQDADTSKPVYGDNICASLDCGSFDTNGDGKIESDEENYRQGERWCATYSDLSVVTNVNETEWDATVNSSTENLPGSRYVVLECRNGEVLETGCEAWRNQICAGDYYDLNGNGVQDLSDYRTAECVSNRWQDCVIQTNQASCEDSEDRDCLWIEGTSILKDGDTGASLATDENGNKIEASCVPKFAPGLDITQESDSGTTSCSLATTSCVVTYEFSLFRNRGKIEDADMQDRIKYCTDNCYCIPGYTDGAAKNKYEKNKPSTDPKSYNDWVASLNLVCSALGDCGNKINYIGEDGYQREDIIDTGDFEKNKFFGN